MKLNIIHGGRTERYESILEQVAFANIQDYEIWQGLFDKNSVVRSINLSHRQIIEYAKLKGDKIICIAEDDIVFTHPNSYNYFLENIPQSFDIYLGGIYVGDILSNNTVKSFSGFHLYIVHEKFYDTYLSIPEDVHVDRALSNLGDFYVCNPMVAIQKDDIFSSNTGKVENYQHLLKDKAIYKG